MSPPERVAAIDIGSNTILLLIAEYDPTSGLKILEEVEDQPRLGAGLGATGRLAAQPMDRALQSLDRMVELCRSRGARRIRAVATAAVREAENGREFVQRARDHGIPLEVISPVEEAELAFLSAAYHFPGTPGMLVADIGGGSLELIGGTERRIELIRSMPLGAVRLTELGVPLPELRDRVRAALRGALLEQKWAGSQLIGSGGTFATAAAVTQARRASPDQPIQGIEVSREELEHMIHELSEMSPEHRRRVPGLPPARADIIVAGLVVAAELLDQVSATTVRINRLGLREGLVLEMLGLDQPGGSNFVSSGD